MSDGIISLIDRALDALLNLDPDVLSHVAAGQEGFAGPGRFSAPKPEWNEKEDADTLWKWINKNLRVVLEDLGQNKREAARFAKMLPPPEGVQRALDAADRKNEERREKLDTAFSGNPIVFLWALWRNWAIVTHLQAIPGVPDWPGLVNLPQKKQISIYSGLGHIGIKINRNPGVAANQLKHALEQLLRYAEEHPQPSQLPAPAPSGPPQVKGQQVKTKATGTAKSAGPRTEAEAKAAVQKYVKNVLNFADDLAKELRCSLDSSYPIDRELTKATCDTIRQRTGLICGIPNSDPSWLDGYGVEPITLASWFGCDRDSCRAVKRLWGIAEEVGNQVSQQGWRPTPQVVENLDKAREMLADLAKGERAGAAKDAAGAFCPALSGPPFSKGQNMPSYFLVVRFLSVPDDLPQASPNVIYPFYETVNKDTAETLRAAFSQWQAVAHSKDATSRVFEICDAATLHPTSVLGFRESIEHCKEALLCVRRTGFNTRELVYMGGTDALTQWLVNLYLEAETKSRLLQSETGKKPQTQHDTGGEATDANGENENTELKRRGRPKEYSQEQKAACQKHFQEWRTFYEQWKRNGQKGSARRAFAKSKNLKQKPSDNMIRYGTPTRKKSRRKSGK